MPKPRAMRAAFLSVFAALAIGITALNVRFDTWLVDDNRSGNGVDQMIASATISLAELKAAQAAYVGTGQNPAVWTARVTDLLGQLDATIATLASATTSADAASHYAAAAKALKDVSAIDGHAREQVDRGERFLGADLLFLDGFEANRRTVQELTAANASEHAAMNRRQTRIKWWRIGANGAALAFGFALFVLASRQQNDKTSSEARSDAGVVAPSDARTLELSPPRTVASSDPRTVAPIDLPAAAELCVDLGRLLDGHDLPGLLSRAVDVLNAKGLVLWMAEPGGTHLRPALAHGYSDRILERMGALPADADNVTSLAFRTLDVQTVPQSGDGRGAIAAPLITSHGCTGVLSVELSGAPADATRALTRILAAQLAGLVSQGQPGTAAARAGA